MKILAIETSCDETSVAIVEDGTNVLSNVISSTKDTFSNLGGVIPEDAARHQVEYILPVINKALKDAGVGKDDIDAIAVTSGPGLLVSLVVGVTAARTLASVWKKPLIGVHHTLGHLTSPWLLEENPKSEIRNPNPIFPCITLSASGGHTDLWLRESHTVGKLLGSTIDDAAGEAFDKGAALLGLPYPGGPSISKAAERGDSKSYDFPIALKGQKTCNFSFSGLKTSLKNTIAKVESEKLKVESLAAAYQEAICLQLVDRVKIAAKLYLEVKEIHIVGGVSANIRLREIMHDQLPAHTIRTPVTIEFCTDNAAMIGAAAYFMAQEKGEGAYEEFTTKASISLQ